MFNVVSLGDTLTVAVSDGAHGGEGAEGGDVLTANVDDIPLDGSNLVIKAFEQFRRCSGRRERFRAHLSKVVPAGAGLGGGSANASTALYAANQLCGFPASEADLMRWSGDVGSDCPVFFSLGSAYCTSRGEDVLNLDPNPLSPSTPILLVKPPIGLSTGKIFKALDLNRRSTADPEELLSGIQEGGQCTRDLCVNDLEAPAFAELPELGELRRRLEEESDGRFDAVFMSGSGSTIVCIGSDDAPEFLSEPRYKDLFISPARFMSRDPGEWYKLTT